MGTGGVFLRKIRAQVSDEPDGFAWVEKGRLAASGYPASRGQVEWLAKHGIDAVLTLTPEPLPEDYVDGLGLSLGHVPMQDHAPPDLVSLDKAANYIAESLKQGKTIVVHCLAGEGRTGSALAAYLIKYRNESAKEALANLRNVKPEFVEWAQEKRIYEYGEGRGHGSPTYSS